MRFIITIIAALCHITMLTAQTFSISGVVVDADGGKPVEFATLLVKDGGQWAVSDDKGTFVIKGLREGNTTITVQCLGYQKKQHTYKITGDMRNVRIALQEDNLKLQEVEVVATRKRDEATTSYVIDRLALENQQIVNLGDITTLLPGGKTVNGTLMSDSRLALRSDENEKGNASFGTAVEIDGIRLDNNAATLETAGSSLRNIATSNVESVEIITGIPSVEYGDLSNGIVKVNTKKGNSPFIVEGRINQHTRQIGVSKGFNIGKRAGIVNAAFEHARSFSDPASPHTAYQRNVLTLNYSNTFMRNTTPLSLNIGLYGNVGGYNSKSDPDEELDDYSKARDNSLRLSFDTKWLLNAKWLTNISLTGSLSMADKKTERYNHTSSPSTQPYIHTTNLGYEIAQNYGIDPATVSSDYDIPAETPIVLGPTGYWYVKSFNSSKPLSWQLKLKAEKTARLFTKAGTRQGIISNLIAGIQWSGSKNNGRGTYYDRYWYAPTWREYRYDQQPAMHNLALYAEEKISIPMKIKGMPGATAEITAGLRDDITMIKGSDYGTAQALSPRINTRLILWKGKKAWVGKLAIHAGWGKSVKLPSYQVLFPTPSYSDHLAFAATSTADNTSYYAYHTYPTTAVYNKDLKWQYTNQTDIGVEMTFLGTKINISAFWQRTHNPYMATMVYTPFTFHYTTQAALQATGIAAENRAYSIDKQTGAVTVSDNSGATSPITLAYENRNTYTGNTKYVNASPIDRYGLEWIVDFPQIKPIRTQIRLDGNYYRYKGTDETLFADVPLGISSTQSDGQPYSYIGYYKGANATSAGYYATASVSNGSLSKRANLNATITTHIPKIRLIVALRIETSLYRYNRPLCEAESGTRGYALQDKGDYFGTPYNGETDKYVAVYPEYYSTWSDPDTRIPFYEKYLWAKDNDQQLYNDLSKLVVRTNYPYTLNPNKVSAYYSANLSITKEIGNHVSISFYANNFFNNTKSVTSSQTNLETSLFGSGYIPGFYYGLSLKLKI